MARWRPYLIIVCLGAIPVVLWLARTPRDPIPPVRTGSTTPHLATVEADPLPPSARAPLRPEIPSAEDAPDSPEAAQAEAFDHASQGVLPAPLANMLSSNERWPTTPEIALEIQRLLELVAAALRAGRFDDMAAFIAAITSYGTSAIAPLLDAFDHADGEMLRLHAAVALGELQAELSDPALAMLLREHALPYLDDLAMNTDDASLRHAALGALGKIADPVSFDLLVDVLTREREGVIAERAGRSLTELRGPEITDALAALAREEPDPALRRSLTDALAAREDPAALETLEDLSRSDYSDEVRLAAINGLAALPGAEADALLRDIVRSPESPDLRAAALAGLGTAGDKRDLGLMEDALRFSSSNQIRRAAYQGLARIGTPGARRVMEDYRPGALIDRVFHMSNAEASGLLSEDLVTEYDGMTVEGAVEFKALVHGTQPNRVVPLKVQRDGRTISMRVTGGFLGVVIENGVARN